jgi:hypothetical protein
MLWACDRGNGSAGCIQGSEFRVPLKDCLSQEGLCYLELVSLWEVHTPFSHPRVKFCANEAFQTSYSNERSGLFVLFLISLSRFRNL